MAILPYKRQLSNIEISSELVRAYEEGVQSKTLLTALGDYWVDYYVDADTLATVATGAVALYSQEYSRVLDYVLASNILDIPVEKPVAYQLYGFSEEFFNIKYTDNGSIDYIYVEFSNVVDIEYFVSSLFEPEVILEKGKHFDIVGNELRFYVDIFGDKNITDYSYTVGAVPRRQILLWATNVVFEDHLIYERYGRFLYRKDKDSHTYLWLIQALLHYYTNTKSVKRIEAVLNVLYGLPLSRYHGEKVLSITLVDKYLQPTTYIEDSVFYRIVTTHTEYYVYSFADLVVKEGDILYDYQLLAKFHIVEDYITNPVWYENFTTPHALVESGENPYLLKVLLEKVLKYNIVYIKLIITFETYKQYKEQVSELYGIIKSGFPVYLYPLIEVYFNAKFYDSFRVEEIFNLFSQFSMKHEDIYERCYGGRNFTGKRTYFSNPILDHGSKFSILNWPVSGFTLTANYNSVLLYDGVYWHDYTGGPKNRPELKGKTYLRFNSKFTYDDSKKHNWFLDGVNLFNGEFMYSRPFGVPETEPLHEFGHDCETDPYSIQSTTGIAEQFEWARLDNPVETTLLPVFYNLKNSHNGDVRFSNKIAINNYEFEARVCPKFTETVPVTESSSVVSQFDIYEEITTNKCFNNKATYFGAKNNTYNIGTLLTFDNSTTYSSENIHLANKRNSADLSGVFFVGYKQVEYTHSGWFKDNLYNTSKCNLNEQFEWGEARLIVLYNSRKGHTGNITFGVNKLLDNSDFTCVTSIGFTDTSTCTDILGVSNRFKLEDFSGTCFTFGGLGNYTYSDGNHSGWFGELLQPGASAEFVDVCSSITDDFSVAII